MLKNFKLAVSNITKIPLNPYQVAHLINSILIPKFTYLISILPWNKGQIKFMDTEIRKCARNLCALPNLKNDDIIKPQTEGGLGITSIGVRRKNAILKLIKEPKNEDLKLKIEEIRISYVNKPQPKSITNFRSLIGIHLNLKEETPQVKTKNELLFDNKKDLKEFILNSSTRELRFYLASANNLNYIMTKRRKKSETISCRFCNGGDDSLPHWFNECSNINVQKLFSNETKKINYLKSKGKLDGKLKVKIWKIKYETYVNLHRLKIPKKTLANNKNYFSPIQMLFLMSFTSTKLVLESFKCRIKSI